MPNEIRDAIAWALQQKATYDGVEIQITVTTSQALVDKVREYFNKNDIAYVTFSYDHLLPFLN